ncbi:MAG: glycosyltransferase family 2 protein [Lachnospirales bacterium]
MKTLSIVVPSYNSEKYLEKSINSLLVGGEEVEIIIVNDGSTDKTKEIAENYEKEYPTIIRVVNKENGGHGDAVCAGVAVAEGEYLKVCDSDDWFNGDAYKKVLNGLKKIIQEKLDVDMVISNFVYEKEYIGHQKTMGYRNFLKEDIVFGWEDFKPTFDKYILMHSVIYKTEILRKCNLSLPKHTFYVDNLYVYIPLPYVEKMYYIDADLYRYHIGREDQSVNEKNMIKRIDQQIYVNKKMVEIFNDSEFSSVRLEKYMVKYLQIITTISSILLLKSGTEENFIKKNDLWAFIKNEDVILYNKLRKNVQGILLNLPSFCDKFAIGIYELYRKIWGFN